MKKLFLCSSFADVSDLLQKFAKEKLKNKTVTFIPTASIPEKIKFYVGADRKALEKLGLIIDELEISKTTSEEISRKIKQNDYIFVSGGNTFFLLQEIKKTNTDKVFIDEINNGKLYIGASAGSMIMSPNIEYVKDMDNCKKATDLEDYSSLSLVDFYPLPHYTNFPFVKATEKIINKFQSRIKLIPISNSQVILVRNNKVKVQSK